MSVRSSKTRSAKAHSAPKPTAKSAASDGRLKAAICAALAVITVAAYWRVLGAMCVVLDDGAYLFQNPMVLDGLKLHRIAQAFTIFHSGNWHPLTWMSHMTDCQLYGPNAMGHHLTSLLFHAANAILLFLVLAKITGSTWRSAFVAALFAIHPLHVESVAWISERKDVLSTFFWMLTMWAYVSYVRRPGAARYALMVVFYALGLMSKPMLVSLPLVLLLLDVWPLGRADLRWRLVWEKSPLFAMSAASCVVTMLAQRSGGAVVTLDALPLSIRIANAAIAYTGYIQKMLWPSGLSVLYPHPLEKLPVWWAAVSGVMIAAATYLSIRAARRRPYVTVGWLWYVITLVPVIGIVQVGSQSMADRYTYVPLTGLFIIIAWGVPDLLARRAGALLKPTFAAAVIAVAVLAGCTWVQAGFWRDTDSLLGHAVKVMPDHTLAYLCWGEGLNHQRRYDEARKCFEKAVRIDPRDPTAHLDLGIALSHLGKYRQAIAEYELALRLGRNDSDVHFNLANDYFNLGMVDMALRHCRIALHLDPKHAPSHNLVGAILNSQGKLDEAISRWQIAVKFAPAFCDAHINLACAYYIKGDYKAAWREAHLFERCGGQLDPGFVQQLWSKMPDPGE